MVGLKQNDILVKTLHLKQQSELAVISLTVLPDFRFLLGVR